MHTNTSTPRKISLSLWALSGLLSAPLALAEVLPDGNYRAVINEPPELLAGTKIPDVGTDGAWNSTLSLNTLPSTTGSQGMWDNEVNIPLGGGKYFGSSQLGNGAGSWDITVYGSHFIAGNFQVDAVQSTFGGDFVQAGMIVGGTIDQTTGAMTLDVTGRLGGFSSVGGYNKPWNIDDYTDASNTTYQSFTTGTQTAPVGAIRGAAIKNISDVDGDGRDDYNVILVSGGIMGKAWGPFWPGASYFETWNVNLLSSLHPSDCD